MSRTGSRTGSQRGTQRDSPRLANAQPASSTTNSSANVRQSFSFAAAAKAEDDKTGELTEQLGEAGATVELTQSMLF